MHLFDCAFVEEKPAEETENADSICASAFFVRPHAWITDIENVPWLPRLCCSYKHHKEALFLKNQNSKLRTLFDVTMFTQHIRRITDLRGIREAEEEEVNIIANWPRRL